MYIHLTDAHCHLTAEDLEADALELSGLDLCASACFSYEWESLSKFSTFPIKKAYGLHPDLQVSEFDDLSLVEDGVFSAILPELQQYLISASAIGETGLDARIFERVPLKLQRKIFEAQLDLSAKFNLPVIVHCVDCWGEIFDILKNWSGQCEEPTQTQRLMGICPRKFLIHAAKCSPEMAREFAKIKGYFSFGLRELDSKKGELCAQSAPEDRLLIETDSENVSMAALECTLERLAKIRNADAFELSEKIWNNFNRFYEKK